MSTTMNRPSTKVAAQRRRVFLWLPLLALGILVSAAGGPMIDVFNGLDVLGLLLTAVGVRGFLAEVDL